MKVVFICEDHHPEQNVLGAMTCKCEERETLSQVSAELSGS